MSRWNDLKLKEIAGFYNGKGIKSIQSGKHPVYGSNGVINHHDDYNFMNGVIIGRVGAYCGSINISISKFWSSDNTIVAQPKVGNSMEYLYYMLQTMKLNNYAGGSAQPLLTQRVLKHLKIQIPGLETQGKIADILSTYDELMENNNRRIEVLGKAVEEIYKEWFVRMRFPSYENAKFKKGIPEGWEIKKVGELISFDIGGGWGKDKSEDDFTQKAYVIRGTDIPDMKYGKFNYEILRFHKENNLKTRRLEDNDIIFEASGGSSNQRLGRTFYITDSILNVYDEDVVCASFCKLIRTGDKYLSWFLNNYLNYTYKTGILSIFEVQSTGISNFRFTSFKKHHNILIPEERLVKTFFKLTYDIQKRMTRLWSKNQNLIKQRDLLLPRLMNGTIKVK